MLPHFLGSQSVFELDSTCDIGRTILCPIHIRDDLVDLILLLSRTCHQHQLRGCYSCSLICMFLYIFFSRYFSTTRITAMKCDVSAYVVLIMCNSSCFLHKVHQFQPIYNYQSVWRDGGWSRAVCSVGIFFTSFQPSPQIPSYAVWRDGDDLEDISNVEIQIENHPSFCSHKNHRRGTCNLWWGRELLGSYVDYLNRASLWSFCTNVTGGKRLVQSLMREEFLGSSMDCYIRTASLLFCTDIAREEGGCAFSVEFYDENLSTYVWTNVTRERSWKGRGEGERKTSFNLQTCGRIVYYSLFHYIYQYVKLIITFSKVLILSTLWMKLIMLSLVKLIFLLTYNLELTVTLR